MGCKSPSGYGVVRYRTENWIASRLAWTLTSGAEPEGFVCHRCDNPPCCNPAHLFVGTQADNMADCSQKGRARGPNRKGSQHGNARLSDTQVLEIRRRRSEGEKLLLLAKEFGVTEAAISGIARRISWKHL